MARRAVEGDPRAARWCRRQAASEAKATADQDTLAREGLRFLRGLLG